MTLTSIENAWGGAFDDLLLGDGGANFLYGGDGNDTLVGAAGNDILDGGAGTDTLDGGLGNDSYYVTQGDVLIDAGGVDTIYFGGSFWRMADGFEISDVCFCQRIRIKQLHEQCFHLFVTVCRTSS